jgi:N-acetylmuramoyl-L-alanine amidase
MLRTGAFLHAWLTFTLANLVAQDRVSPLSPPVEWKRLDAFQETVTRTAFVEALETFYSIGDAYKHTIEIQEHHARIQTGEDKWITLKFSKDGVTKSLPSRYWRSREALLPSLTKQRPLNGVRIALDPGHLGGPWARMEERWYVMDDGGKPVTEGDLTLVVAKMLETRLKALGATVLAVRTSSKPTTPRRPKDFEALAREDLKRMGVTEPTLTYAEDAPPEERRKTVQWHSEKYFYRLSEIRHRAELVNNRLKPDLALCLHFNAEAWGDPSEPEFVPANHLHFLINGAYSTYELGMDDERFQMLIRLLQGTHVEELALAEAVAPELARQTQLPAFDYITNNVKRPSKNPYVYARNLLANRLFECPVLYLEPYVMNSQDVYARVQAGLYEGEIEVNGVTRPSIFHEYVEGTVQGLLAYFNTHQDKPNE